jgi:hypothetical protein
VPQSPASKQYYTFVAGINTEAHGLAFPDNASVDEENCELMVGGYRRRRYGLDYEQNYSVAPVNTITGLDYNVNWASAEHAWRSVGGVATRNWIIQQIGPHLYFYDDNRVSFSANRLGFTVDLRQLKVAGATDAQICETPVAFTNGIGRCLVVSPYVEPFYIQYTPAESPDPEIITTVPITVTERDFIGVEDGVPLSTQPLALTDTHEYNLQNRGWKIASINTFETDIGSWPAKNMRPAKGYRRQSPTDYYDVDGILEFSPAKLVEELFQDVSAPQGAFVINTFKPSTVVSGGAVGGTAILKRAYKGTRPNYDLVVVVDDPITAIVGDDVVLTDCRIRIENTDGKPMTINMSGTWEILAIGTVGAGSGGSFDGVTGLGAEYVGKQAMTLDVTWPSFFKDTYYPDQFAPDLGAVSLPGDNIVPNGLPNEDRRFSAVAFYAGRVFYAGADTERLSSRIYFSQICEVPSQFGKCYQVADPTDEDINDLVPSDGGVIVIPELGKVVALHPFQKSLIILTQTGVWELSGDFRDPFTATGYVLRRLSDARVYAPKGVCTSDNQMFYAAADGLHVVRLDPQAGILVDENISEDRVQSLWSAIPSQNWDKVKALYDPVRKRVLWLYSAKITGIPAVTNGWKYDKALVFDTRLLSYFKYSFYDGDPWIIGAIVPRQFCCTGEPVIKFATLFTDEDDELQFTYSEQQFPGVPSAPRELDDESFLDWGNDVPAYVITGAEVLGDASRIKQAPVIHTYMKRTETGYELASEDVGETDYVPKNESSCLMQVRWDWADDAAYNKWSVKKQIYKQPKPIAYDTDVHLGVPVVVTREKVFGIGRAIQLKFESEPGKPFELLGWSIEFNVNQVA